MNMDFSKLEAMRDVMVEQGKLFFSNALNGLLAAGIDINDPLEMIFVLSGFNPLKFEQAFHSTTCNEGMAEIKPFYPTVLGRQTVQIREDEIAKLYKNGLKDALEGKKIVLASGDAHTYGLLLVEGLCLRSGPKW